MNIKAKTEKPVFMIKNERKPKKQVSKKIVTQNINKPVISRNLRFIIYGILIAVSFILYGNTLPYNYAFDDTIVITGNQFVKQGFAGISDIFKTDMFTGYYGKDMNMVVGGRYRPLSLATFAIEYQFFGENPRLSHFINILCYALTAIILFNIISFFLNNNKKFSENLKRWYISIPFITSLLFLAHPIHTEAIANIKGRDEIFALLFSLLSLWYSIQFSNQKKARYLLYAVLTFFLGLLSKENTITFLAIIPLSIYYFTKDTLKNNWLLFSILIFSTIIFLIIRQGSINVSKTGLENDLMNNPFVEMNFMEKYATIFYTLGLYVKLLFFPHPLTYDYYPYHIPIVGIFQLKAIVPILIYVVLIALAIVGFKKKSLISFAIIYYISTISIVSNLLFPIGAFMNERFEYMPSVAFCLSIPVVLFHYIPEYLKNKKIAFALSLTVLLVYLSFFTIKTILRNEVWESSSKLFLTDVNVSKNSAKGNSLAGEYLIYQAREEKNQAKKKQIFEKSLEYLNKTIEIYPKHVLALLNIAAVHYEMDKNYDECVKAYLRLAHINPDGDIIYQNMFKIFGTFKDNNFKIKALKQFYELNPNRFDLNLNLGVLEADNKNYSLAIPYLEKAVQKNLQSFEAYSNLGFCYAMSNRYQESLHAFLEAEKLMPNDSKTLTNIAIIYKNIGNIQKSNEYFAKAKTK